MRFAAALGIIRTSLCLFILSGLPSIRCIAALDLEQDRHLPHCKTVRAGDMITKVEDPVCTCLEYALSNTYPLFVEWQHNKMPSRLEFRVHVYHDGAQPVRVSLVGSGRGDLPLSDTRTLLPQDTWNSVVAGETLLLEIGRADEGSGSMARGTLCMAQHPTRVVDPGSSAGLAHVARSCAVVLSDDCVDRRNTCNDMGVLVGLDMSGLDLRCDWDAEWLRGLPHVSHLNVSHTGLRGTLDLPAWTDLDVLDVSYTQLSRVRCSECTVRVFWARNTTIVSGADAVAASRHVEHMDVAFSTRHEPWVARLGPSMVWFSADYSQMVGVQWNNSAGLQSVHADFNRMTSLPAHWPGAMRVASVARNRIAYAPPVISGNMTWLDLSQNALRQPIDDWLGDGVVYLAVSGNRVVRTSGTYPGRTLVVAWDTCVAPPYTQTLLGSISSACQSPAPTVAVHSHEATSTPSRSTVRTDTPTHLLLVPTRSQHASSSPSASGHVERNDGDGPDVHTHPGQNGTAPVESPTEYPKPTPAHRMATGWVVFLVLLAIVTQVGIILACAYRKAVCSVCAVACQGSRNGKRANVTPSAASV